MTDWLDRMLYGASDVPPTQETLDAWQYYAEGVRDMTQLNARESTLFLVNLALAEIKTPAQSDLCCYLAQLRLEKVKDVLVDTVDLEQYNAKMKGEAHDGVG